MHEDPADGPLRFREHADLRILDPRLRELSAEQPPARELEEEAAVDAHGLAHSSSCAGTSEAEQCTYIRLTGRRGFVNMRPPGMKNPPGGAGLFSL